MQRFSVDAYERAKAELTRLRVDKTETKENVVASTNNRQDQNENESQCRIDAGPEHSSLDFNADMCVEAIDKQLDDLQSALTAETERFGVRWSTDAIVHTAIVGIRRTVKTTLLDANRARLTAQRVMMNERNARQACEMTQEQKMKEIRDKQACIIAKGKENMRRQMTRERVCMKGEFDKLFEERWRKNVAKLTRQANDEGLARSRAAAIAMDARLKQLEQALLADTNRLEAELFHERQSSAAAIADEVAKRESLEQNIVVLTKKIDELNSVVHSLGMSKKMAEEQYEKCVKQHEIVEEEFRIKLDAHLKMRTQIEREFDEQKTALISHTSSLTSEYERERQLTALNVQKQLEHVYARVKCVVDEKEAEIKGLREQLEKSLRQVLDAVECQ